MPTCNQDQLNDFLLRQGSNTEINMDGTEFTEDVTFVLTGKSKLKLNKCVFHGALVVSTAASLANYIIIEGQEAIFNKEITINLLNKTNGSVILNKANFKAGMFLKADNIDSIQMNGINGSGDFEFDCHVYNNDCDFRNANLARGRKLVFKRENFQSNFYFRTA